MAFIYSAKLTKMISLGCVALFVAALSACTPFKSDVEFCRRFLLRLKTHDPAMATDISPELLKIESWQEIDSTFKTNLPAAAIDSVVFSIHEINSSFPPTNRKITLNVFGGSEYSIAEIRLETEEDEKTAVNMIRIRGPFALH